MKLGPVPRPCVFLACSTKSSVNFVLQVTNVQGLGMRNEARPGNEARPWD